MSVELETGESEPVNDLNSQSFSTKPEVEVKVSIRDRKKEL